MQAYLNSVDSGLLKFTAPLYGGSGLRAGQIWPYIKYVLNLRKIVYLLQYIFEKN